MNQASRQRHIDTFNRRAALVHAFQVLGPQLVEEFKHLDKIPMVYVTYRINELTGLSLTEHEVDKSCRLYGRTSMFVDKEQTWQESQYFH
jgi:hypothetical protein